MTNKRVSDMTDTEIQALATARQTLDARILATSLVDSHSALLLLADKHADEVAAVLDRVTELTGVNQKMTD